MEVVVCLRLIMLFFYLSGELCSLVLFIAGKGKHCRQQMSYVYSGFGQARCGYVDHFVFTVTTGYKENPN